MNKKIILAAVVICLGVILFSVLAYLWYMNEASTNHDFFENEIQAFEDLDKESFPKSDGIVFVGSSSIRFWDTLVDDMAPLPVIRRGFGGAHMSHVLYNFDRIITPYKPKAVVVFVGGNDMGAGKSGQQLVEDYKTFINKLEMELPTTDLWILGMKPSKLRWELWDEMKKVDEAFKALAESNKKITFVDSGSVLLNVEGKPDDVYIIDGLHLNAEGYRRWTGVLKPLLLKKYHSDDKSLQGK